MTYVSYQMSQAGRRVTLSEQQAADARIGQLSAALSDSGRWLRGRWSTRAPAQEPAPADCAEPLAKLA